MVGSLLHVQELQRSILAWRPATVTVASYSLAKRGQCFKTGSDCFHILTNFYGLHPIRLCITRVDEIA